MFRPPRGDLHFLVSVGGLHAVGREGRNALKEEFAEFQGSEMPFSRTRRKKI